MTDGIMYLFLSLYVLLWVAVAVSVWRCYRRTSNPGFLWLALAVVGWPLIDFAFGALAYQYVNNGGAFPFLNLSPGDLKAAIGWTRQVLGMALLAVCTGLLAKSLKRAAPE